MTKALQFELKGAGGAFYCYIKVVGDLTHNDYVEFAPLFGQSLSCVKEPKVKVLVDITQLKGWELRAAWDDLMFGIKYNSIFDKIAVVGESTFYNYAVKLGNMFTPYEMRYFEDIQKATLWLGVK